MVRPIINAHITVNEKSHSVRITYADSRGLVVAERRFAVKQRPGGVGRTTERLAEAIRQALQFAEEELF